MGTGWRRSGLLVPGRLDHTRGGNREGGWWRELSLSCFLGLTLSLYLGTLRLCGPQPPAAHGTCSVNVGLYHHPGAWESRASPLPGHPSLPHSRPQCKRESPGASVPGGHHHAYPTKSPLLVPYLMVPVPYGLLLSTLLWAFLQVPTVMKAGREGLARGGRSKWPDTQTLDLPMEGK